MITDYSRSRQPKTWDSGTTDVWKWRPMTHPLLSLLLSTLYSILLCIWSSFISPTTQHNSNIIISPTYSFASSINISFINNIIIICNNIYNHHFSFSSICCYYPSPSSPPLLPHVFNKKRCHLLIISPCLLCVKYIRSWGRLLAGIQIQCLASFLVMGAVTWLDPSLCHPFIHLVASLFSPFFICK